jgi:hypothetical protein
MPVPSQTFTTIQQLYTYINTLFIANGANSITGDEGNNILNGLGTFIQKYTLNNSLVTIYGTSPSVYPLATPMTVFTTVPTSIQWAGNVQNEYYITNATSAPIPLSNGYAYIDQYGTSQTSIPARTTIHIAKATNQSWIQQNNLPGSGGGGGLPPVTGHAGQSLFTDGTGEMWGDVVLPIYAGDSNWVNATQWTNGHGTPVASFPSSKFLVFWNDASRFLLPAEYQLTAGTGFNVLVFGFDSATANIFLFFRGVNS